MDAALWPHSPWHTGTLAHTDRQRERRALTQSDPRRPRRPWTIDAQSSDATIDALGRHSAPHSARVPLAAAALAAAVPSGLPRPSAISI
ncbi:hypothetical protein BC831DRAFT_477384, partial [Entophlyctis helioformis]